MRGLGQIAELCEIARPDVGIVTSIGPVHLELLGTVERVAQAKAELIERLPPGGTAVVPAGEAYLEPYLARDDLEVFRFGDGGDVEPRYFAAARRRARIRVEAFGRPLTLEFNFSSRYNATNALAALAAYQALGLPLGEGAAGRPPGPALAPARRGGSAPRRRHPAQRLLQREPALDGGRARASRRAGRPGSGRSRSSATWPSSARGLLPTTARSGAAAARAGVEVLVAVGPLARGYVEGAARRRRHALGADRGAGARRAPLASSGPATACWSRARARWASRWSPRPSPSSRPKPRLRLQHGRSPARGRAGDGDLDPLPARSSSTSCAGTSSASRSARRGRRATSSSRARRRWAAS